MIRIIGIDGLDKNILDRHIHMLPNFRKVRDIGILAPVDSVFPADSVPAWTTIFTGLNPAQHGIIRGKDYIESIEAFQEQSGFKLQGQTFWDYFSALNRKCLVINPFLAYPAWPINGIMESGPAFIAGSHSIFPADAGSQYPQVLGGYSAISNLAGLRTEMEEVFSDTKKLWKEYDYQSVKDNFNLEFVTFTTLDRLQHYTWRFYDVNDPLHERDDYYSNCIFRLLKAFDEKIGTLILKMNEKDVLLLISDHGFRQRPYSLINLNEYLRKNDLLVFKQEFNNQSTKRTQNVKKKLVSILSRFKLLDFFAKYLKKISGISKLKKSDYLIDKENSTCYTDDLFSGKKPYVGLNYGGIIRNSDNTQRDKAFERICSVLNSGDIPRPVWIKKSDEVYTGPYQSKMPDVCIEFPPENGVEFNYFGDIMENSSTHYRISGGHFGSGTFGYYSKNKSVVHPPSSIIDFYRFVKSLPYESSISK